MLACFYLAELDLERGTGRGGGGEGGGKKPQVAPPVVLRWS